MSKAELWRKFAARNPSFDGDGAVTLSARGLRKLFSQTWDIAYGAGERGEEDQMDEPSGGSGDDTFSELMKMFGMKK